MRHRSVSTYSRTSSRYPIMLTFVVSVALVALLLVGSAGERPEATPEGISTGETVGVTLEGTPTPFFASYRSLQLCLPVRPEAITTVAFHQAAGQRALSLDPLVPVSEPGTADDPASTGGTETVGSTGTHSAVWSGSAIQLWRSNRSGPPDTAVDCGATPGSTVYAPASGRVMEVRRYSLYGECDDFEVHIRPEGWDETDIVLIHIDEVTVSPGDDVIGGVTPIASVRRLSDRIDLQLGQYAEDGGDHVHMQVNEVEDPLRLESVGSS
jgi:hypothetical protein